MSLELIGQVAPTFGIKGKAAAAWLASQHIILPEQPNTWRVLVDGSRILRLGCGEYLVDGSAAEALDSAWQGGLPDLYRVPRYDVGFTLSGDMARNTLAEICALDVRPEIIGNGVLMTLAAGISVTLIQEDDTYRIWCDATYGEYLQHTLQELMD
jgi:sarcosine oxidase subunit gamma